MRLFLFRACHFFCEISFWKFLVVGWGLSFIRRNKLCILSFPRFLSWLGSITLNNYGYYQFKVAKFKIASSFPQCFTPAREYSCSSVSPLWTEKSRKDDTLPLQNVDIAPIVSFLYICCYTKVWNFSHLFRSIKRNICNSLLT